MKLSGGLLFAAVALFASDKVFSKTLTIIEPCPSAPSLSLPAITVTTQYQPVSTCQATTACIKGKCSTIYPFTTYPYVSTVIPCAWNGTTTQTTTVTQVKQAVRASEHLETLTHVTSAPYLDKAAWIDWFKQQPSATKKVTSYETVSRRAIAPYDAIGPLAIPGWNGSGLCKKCVQNNGALSQLLAVTECRLGTKSGQPYQRCLEWQEVWIAQPPSTVHAEAPCSSTGTVPQAGVYTWTFPQAAPSVTVTKPPVTVTVTVDNGRPKITTQARVQVIPGRPWNAYITKSFDGPTTFNFEIFVTKVFVFEIPPTTSSAGSSWSVPIPTGPGSHLGGGNNENGWWPLPGGDASWTSHTGDNVWEDWISTSIVVSSTSSAIHVTTSTSAVTSGPIGGSSTSSSRGSSTGSSQSSSTTVTSGPISGLTTSSRSTSTSTSRSTTSHSITASTSAPSTSTNAISSGSSSLSSSISTSGSGDTSVTSSFTATSTASTTSIVPSGSGFYLQISGTPVTGLTPRQTVVRYVGFDSSNHAIAVEGISEAAQVFKGSDNTTFFSDNRYLGTATLTRSIVQRFLDFPRGFAVWDIIGIFAHLRNTAGFCFDNGFVYAYTDSDICDNPINIIPTNPATTSTTSATPTSIVTGTSTSSLGTASTSVTSISSASGGSTSTPGSSTSDTTGSTTSSTPAVSTTAGGGTSTSGSSGSIGPTTGSTTSSPSSSTSSLSSDTGSSTATQSPTTSESGSTSTTQSALPTSSLSSSEGLTSTTSGGPTISTTASSSEGGSSTSSSDETTTSRSTTEASSSTTVASSTSAEISSTSTGLPVSTSSSTGTASTSTRNGSSSGTETSTSTGLSSSTSTVPGSSTSTESSTGSPSTSTTSSTGSLSTASSTYTSTVSSASSSSASSASSASSSSSSSASSTSSSSSSSASSASSASSSSASHTSAASTTTFTSASTSRTSSGASTTTSAVPICNLNANICLNSQLITANSVAVVGCPLLGGLLCTVNQLLSLVPQLLNTGPSIATVLIGDNEVIGLSITPAEVSAAINAGELNGVCDALGGPVSVIIRDPTCPNSPTTSSTSSVITSSSSTRIISSLTTVVGTSSSSATTSSGSSSGSASQSTSTGTPASTTLTTVTRTSTSTGTTTTSAAPICNLNINICLNAALISANSVATYNCPLLGGLLCTVNDLLSAVPQLLGLNPNIASVLIGNNELIGLTLTPEEVSAAVASGELSGVCDALGGPVSVILDDPTCPANPTVTTSTSSTRATSTTSTAPATTTTAPPLCDAQVAFCAPLVVAFTVRSQVCPNVLGCSDAQMQAFANSFIGLPGVKSVAYADNIAYGFSLTTTQLQQQLAVLGPINDICTAASIFTLAISDTTCPATALPTQQCGVDVALCTLETLASVGVTSGTCSNGILPCTPSQVTSAAKDSCGSQGGVCRAYGNNLLTPLTATQSVAQIQQSIASYALGNTCLAGTTVTLSDSSCT
ncbi:hypothetical protein LTS17_010437 [Exophiala oligosperma]